ncbi:MAG TPA: YceI family protein [Puia sp.]|nr:YceI family protein [Puia sp.]
MKKAIYPFAAILLVAASAFTFIKSQDWKVNDDYTIKFSSEDPSGEFKGLQGAIKFDETDLASSKFDVTVDVSTINTGNGMKNTHAKSDKWFDATKFPTINFTSTSIIKTPSGYDAKGNLQIHGVTKEFTIPFTFQKTATGGIFISSFDINRLDFNINTAEPNHGASKLKVDLNIPVTKA